MSKASNTIIVEKVIDKIAHTKFNSNVKLNGKEISVMVPFLINWSRKENCSLFNYVIAEYGSTVRLASAKMFIDMVVNGNTESIELFKNLFLSFVASIFDHSFRRVDAARRVIKSIHPQLHLPEASRPRAVGVDIRAGLQEGAILLAISRATSKSRRRHSKTQIIPKPSK